MALLVGLLVTQLPRFTQALSTSGRPGAVAARAGLRLAAGVSYINVAIPASAARIAVNVRFFQRHGVSPGAALAAGGLDGIGGLVAQALLLVSLLLFTSASLDLDLGAAAEQRASLLPIVLVIVVLAVAPILLVARLRRFVLGWVRASDSRRSRRCAACVRRAGSGCCSAATSPARCCSPLRSGCSRSPSARRSGIGELLLINISVGLL